MLRPHWPSPGRGIPVGLRRLTCVNHVVHGKSRRVAGVAGGLVALNCDEDRIGGRVGDGADYGNGEGAGAGAAE